MWLKLSPEARKNAERRLAEMWPKCRASKITEREIAVSCVSGDHPAGHVCFYRYEKNLLEGHCVVRATGESCPAAIGKNVCVHLAAGRRLLLALEDIREQAIHATNERLARRAHPDENKALMRTPSGKRVEMVGTIPL